MILQEFRTPDGTITITKELDGTRSYRQKDCLHSAINKEGVSTCAYVHALFSILQQVGAMSIVMIGCAGGTLATMLHNARCDVTVVDVNPLSFTIARQYFGMPSAIDCIVQEGSAFMAAATRSYDAVVIDAFNGDGTIPQQFISEDFFRNVKLALRPRGMAVMNIMTLNDFNRHAHHIASHMRAGTLPPMLFDKPGIEHRNTLILGGAPEHIRIPSGREPAFMREKLLRIKRVDPIR